MKHGLDMSRQAISQHLEALESAGLVTAKRDGRYRFHYLDKAPLAEIIRRWPL
jgi:DNA-binding transcriptional ArsR family regulator